MSRGPAANRGTRPRRRRDERGGAVALMVILVVPALALAAIAAAAVPRRLAAQAALDDSAAQLAVMAAYWRHTQDRPHGPLDWYYPHCTADATITAEPPTDEPDPGPDGRDAPYSAAEPDPIDGLALKSLCQAAADSLDAALSAVRVDAGLLTGYHSGSLSTAPHGEGTHEHSPSVPCRIDPETVAADAVHVAVFASFADSDWAAGQIWPHGITLQANAAAQMTQPAADDGTAELPDCVPLTSARLRAFADRTPGASAFGNPSTP